MNDGEWGIYTFNGYDIRYTLIEGEPWSVAKDCCAMLGLTQVTRALTSVDAADITTSTVRSGSQNRRMKLVNEYGFNELILNSRMPDARKMRTKITHEVMPSLRRTGNYIGNPEPPKAIEPVYQLPQTYGQALLELTESVLTQERQAQQLTITALALEQQREVNAVLEPQAARFRQHISAEGGISVAIVAKGLRVDYGLRYGRDRLYAKLKKMGWVFRNGDGNWEVDQKAIETKRMFMKPNTRPGPDGSRIVCASTPKFSAKGEQDLITYLLKEIEDTNHAARIEPLYLVGSSDEW